MPPKKRFRLSTLKNVTTNKKKKKIAALGNPLFNLNLIAFK